MSAQPIHLLVVSDLHLGAGRDPATRRIPFREDFLFDDELGRFLAWHRRRAAERDFRLHLVVAGDFLDFLQVVATDGAPKGVRWAEEMRRHGLGAGEEETLFKLARIVEGHPRVFDALAALLAEGHLLTVVKGNHDVELHYPGVQAALVAALRARAPAPFPDDAVRMSGWFFHEPGRLWIEHGSQYDALNSFRHLLSPLMPRRRRWPDASKDDVDLPFGSMFVRYLFNYVEDVEPEADNVKPVTTYLAWLLRSHPLIALGFILRHGHRFLAKLRRAWAPLEPGAYDARRREHEEALAALHEQSEIPLEALRLVDGARSATVFEAPRGAWQLVRAAVWIPWAGVAVALLAYVPVLLWLLARKLLARPKRYDPALSDRARWLADALGVRFVVMGDSHDPDVADLERGRAYFNTGTWTRVFEDGGRLVRPETQLTFLYGERTADGDLEMQLMEWHDGPGEPRLARLFGPGASR